MEISSQSTVIEPSTSMNPYPGLRPFNMDEHHLFFGREDQSGEVVEKLWQNHFVSIVGNSGIGKSSFVYCGAIPTLLNTYGGEQEWILLNYRFGDQPVWGLAEMLMPYMKPVGIYETVEELERHMLDDKAFLSSVLLELQSATNKKILLFIDQFEELFRYQLNLQDQAYQFIQMLLHTLQQPQPPLYTILTIRSDFIGDCAQFPALTKEVNKSQFLIPQMTRNERRRAIEEPLKFIGVKVSSDLVDKVLEHMGEKGDHLPIMQHAMMRTFDHWQFVNQGQGQISMKHYLAIGTMEHAMSLHANEVYNGLDEHGKKVCQGLFKTITEKRGEGRGVRKPSSIQEIALVLNEAEEQVIKVVEVFRKPGTTLLMPSSDQEIKIDTMIDISHESLMRIWEMLRIWVEEEAESVKMYLRLAEAAEMHQKGSSGLWLPPDLDLAINWRKRQAPTMAWGLRYHSAFERSMLFLEYSEQEYERVQQLKEKQQKRRLWIARIVAAVLLLGIVIALMFLFYAEQQRRIAAVKSLEAETQRDAAQVSAELAEQSAQKADSAMVVAQFQAQIAVEQSELAREQQKVAEENGRQAQLAEQLAIDQGEKAYRLRLLSVARSMTIKSRQISDSTTQALVALQAYNFFQQNGGKLFDPDIYNGLYYGLKRLKKEAYNDLLGHQFNVRSICAERADNTLYSAASDGKIIRWENNTPELIFDSPQMVHQTMDLSADGRYLLVGGAYEFILLFDLKHSEQVPVSVPFENKESWMIKVGNHSQLASVLTATGEVFKFDLKSKTVESIYKEEHKINTLAMHPFKPVVYFGNVNGHVKCLDLHSGQIEDLFEIKTAAITLAIDPIGERLACGSEHGVVYLYNLQAKKLTSEFRGHKSRVNNLNFSPKSKYLASGSFDRTVRIWDLVNINDQPVILDDHKDWVWSISFSGDGRYLLAGCKDNLIRKWPIKIPDMAMELNRLLTRNLEEQEWQTYVADDIPYQKTRGINNDEMEELNRGDTSRISPSVVDETPLDLADK
ncbi:hypothetical protein [Persicobacter psychrovividus]|uniref:Novel STAND NTPase 1 domain-containing protein n=1 Tax=Persicobacter psychrovividus TaxID=387638 RepID=A0ABM7VK35_9BACT|nr:hypothetical protein PEPS_36230 [Persicobacter psychrovividus]